MVEPIRLAEALLDIRRILDVLAQHEVHSVLVGGVAGVLLGSPLATEDFDLTPAPAQENLDRVAAALCALDAQWRGPGLDEGFPAPAPLTGADLANMQSASFVTRADMIHVVLRHSNGAGFADLEPEARATRVHGHEVLVAFIGAIISAKAAADRIKDRRALPFLHEIASRSAER